MDSYLSINHVSLCRVGLIAPYLLDENGTQNNYTTRQVTRSASRRADRLPAVKQQIPRTHARVNAWQSKSNRDRQTCTICFMRTQLLVTCDRCCARRFRVRVSAWQNCSIRFMRALMRAFATKRMNVYTWPLRVVWLPARSSHHTWTCAWTAGHYKSMRKLHYMSGAVCCTGVKARGSDTFSWHVRTHYETNVPA